MSDRYKKTLYRIYIQPQGRIDDAYTLDQLKEKHGEFALSKNYHLSTIDLTVTDISVEDNKNTFYYDLLMTCLTINKKLRNELDMVMFYIKGMPNISEKGIATAWASFFSLKEMIFFSKIFDGDFHVDFIFDLPYKSKQHSCTSLENNFKEILKSDFYLENQELEKLKKPILSKSGIRTSKIKTIEKYINKINNRELPNADVAFHFLASSSQPVDFPYTVGLFDEDESALNLNPRPYKLKP